MYELAAALDPDRYEALATATFAEMVLAGYTVRRRVPLPPPRTRRRAVRRPQRDRPAADRRAADQAGIRLTLLDTCYLHGGIGAELERGAGAVQRRHGRAVDRRASPSSRRHDRRAASVRRSTRCGPSTRSRCGAVAAWAGEQRCCRSTPTSRSSPQENAECLAAYGVTPVDAARRRRRAERAVHRRARHPRRATATSRRWRSRRSRCCICPTTERDLADGIGPTARSRAAGVDLCLGSDSHAVIDPFEEARAVELDERLASLRRGTHQPADLLAAATAAGYESLGWPGGGTLGSRRAGRLRHRRRSTVRARRIGPRRIRSPPSCSPRPPADVRARRRRRRASSCATACISASTSPPSSTVDRRRLGGRSDELDRRPRDRAAAHQRPDASAAGRPASSTDAWVVDRRRRRSPRSAPGAPPAADIGHRRRRPVRRCPASSTATATSCSPATAPRSSPPGWPARRTRRAASPSRSRRPGRPSDDELRRRSQQRSLAEARRSGTTTIEIKSGYGLSRRRRGSASLSIAGELTDETTFLGAHVVPDEYAGRADDYVALVCGEMLDRVRAARPLDRRVLRDRGVHGRAVPRRARGRARRRARAAPPRQPARSRRRACDSAVELGCASVDHCTYLSDADVEALAGSSTVATFLPATDFSTRQPYPDARRVLDAGVTVALAANCNPGSSYTTSMPFCIALAVRELGMTPDEAILAATVGGAAALRRDDIGTLPPGRARRPHRPRRPVADRLRVPPGRADRRR